MACQQKAIVS